MTAALQRRVRLPQAMTIGEAKAIAGVLGQPSKLPGYSYGLSARRCRRGAELRKKPGSVCSGCYAMNDFYATWRPVQIAHAKRHAGLADPRWVDAMVRLIEHYCRPPDDWFRWHDSGDLQDLEHLVRIVQVVARTPAVRHWLPTRELGLVEEFVLRGGRVPANLVIRLSADMIDAEPVLPDRLRGFPTSTVSTAPRELAGVLPLEGKGSIDCRAVDARENQCGPCRACWDARVTNVNYQQH